MKSVTVSSEARGHVRRGRPPGPRPGAPAEISATPAPSSPAPSSSPPAPPAPWSAAAGRVHDYLKPFHDRLGVPAPGEIELAWFLDALQDTAKHYAPALPDSPFFNLSLAAAVCFGPLAYRLYELRAAAPAPGTPAAPGASPWDTLADQERRAAPPAPPAA